MNGIDSSQDQAADAAGGIEKRKLALAASMSAALLWVSQPPLAFWPLAAVALVPWLFLCIDPNRFHRRHYGLLWLTATVYWLLTLQGLRHAHPAMYLCWMALAGYLAIYPVLFVLLCRQMYRRGMPLWLAAPIAWVGGECLRNYLMTGISAAMLAHTMADVPSMIQIADLLGSYGVSFVLVSINVAAFAMLQCVRRQTEVQVAIPPCLFAALLVIATIGYGQTRLKQPLGQPLATFALIQRDESVEYSQDVSREGEIFDHYARQSMRAMKTAGKNVDAVIWPESTFSGGASWMIADPDAKVPDWVEMTTEEFQTTIRQRRQLYLDRAEYIQSNLAAANPSNTAPPHLIVGCGVVHFRQTADTYSGVVHISSDGDVADWYGKTHLVMFGEYVPILPRLPLLSSLVPPELMLQTGPGAKRFMVGQTAVAPNICIETAVERVTVNQLADLEDRGKAADVVVTVTNDGWFDDSSVIDHHLRCAQLVAVSCRRPLLSAANNGPTAWIDSCGRLVRRLETGTHGSIIATPRRDPRSSLYLRIGDWPARFLALLCIAAGWDALRGRRRSE